MMDNDEKLIAKFFAKNKQEFADNGFSERVMQRLPAQEAVLLNRIWTLLCVAVGVIFIALTAGLACIQTILHNILGDFIGQFASVDLHNVSPLIAVVFFLTLLSVAGYNAIESEQ